LVPGRRVCGCRWKTADDWMNRWNRIDGRPDLQSVVKTFILPDPHNLIFVVVDNNVVWVNVSQFQAIVERMSFHRNDEKVSW